MQAQFYILEDNNPQLQRTFDDDAMQEFLIDQALVEGVLYHTEMTKIKIIYNTHNGEVRLVDIEQSPDISTDYSNAFLAQRRLVESAIRRLVKLELLAELNRMNDYGICEVIKQNHDIDPATGKIRSNTSEIVLDMTLVKVIKLGYTQGGGILQALYGYMNKRSQTQIQKAVFSAFQDIQKQCENSSQVLNQFRSINSIQQFKELITKYL